MPSSPPLPALSLNELIERVLRGTRYFSRDRLGIRLPREDDVIPDLDPFDLDPLEQFALGNALLEDLAGGTDEETALDTLMAQATIPQGLPGELAVRGLRAEVIEVARIGRARCVGEQAEDIEERLTLTVDGLGDCELSGRIDRLWTDARIAVGFARVGRRSELDVWIRHLFLCACVEAGHSAPNESVLIGRSEDKKKLERVVRFGPVANAREELARLFAWAWSAAGSPLPFFPKASRKFASKAATDRDQARRDAVAAYHGGDSTRFIMPESQEELAHERLWEGTDPLSDGDVDAPDLPFEHRFEDLAERVFAPLFAARETDVS
jgi:exodeoxyribonuclease V gamma subunit